MDRLKLPIVQRTFRRRLNVWLDALLRAQEQHASGLEDAEISARRLARGLGSAAGMHALDDLSEAARLAEKSSAARLWERVADLIDIVRHTAHPTDRGQSSVLVVSSDPLTLEVLMGPAAEFAHRVEVVPDEAAARQFVQRHMPGLLFLDLDLPAGDPLTWLLELREGPSAPELPVIALGTEGPLRSEVLALGASEFVRKPIDAARTEAVLGAHLGHEGRTQLELSGDPLTGMPGPALFQEAVGDQSLRHRGRQWCAILIGWDDEAEIRREDAQAADAALRSISDSVRMAFPEPALACRLDHDTFGVLIPDADSQREQARLERLVVGIAASPIAGFSVELVAGGVNALSASFEQVLATARRMRFLASIAGESVLLTTLEAGPQRRVLLVDADPQVASALRSTLQADRTDVVFRRTALEGLEAAAGTSFDVVMVNAALPHKSGFDMLQTLRGWPHYATRPLLMLTGADTERVKAFELGADQCIDKPFNPRVLQAQLRSLFQHPR